MDDELVIERETTPGLSVGEAEGAFAAFATGLPLGTILLVIGLYWWSQR